MDLTLENYFGIPQNLVLVAWLVFGVTGWAWRDVEATGVSIQATKVRPFAQGGATGAIFFFQGHPATRAF